MGSVSFYPYADKLVIEVPGDVIAIVRGVLSAHNHQIDCLGRSLNLQWIKESDGHFGFAANHSDAKPFVSFAMNGDYAQISFPIIKSTDFPNDDARAEFIMRTNAIMATAQFVFEYLDEHKHKTLISVNFPEGGFAQWSVFVQMGGNVGNSLRDMPPERFSCIATLITEYVQETGGVITYVTFDPETRAGSMIMGPFDANVGPHLFLVPHGADAHLFFFNTDVLFESATALRALCVAGVIMEFARKTNAHSETIEQKKRD